MSDSDNDSNGSNNSNESFRKIAIGFAAVTEVFVSTITGFGIGYFLDRWIKRTNLWLTVLCTFLGLIGGFFRLYKVYTREDK